MSNFENMGEIQLFNKHLFIEKCSVMEKLNVETNGYQLWLPNNFEQMLSFSVSNKLNLLEGGSLI